MEDEIEHGPDPMIVKSNLFFILIMLAYTLV